MNDFNLPPQAIDIEQAILGSILLESSCHDVIDILIPEMFYKQSHQVIFEAMRQLRNDKSQIDILTVTDILRKTDELETSGGAFTITSLSNNIGSSAHLGDHVLILIQKYIQREMIRRCSEISTSIYNDDDISDSIAMVDDMLKMANEKVSGDIEIDRLNDLISQSIDLAAIRKENFENGIVPGVPIPIGSLQEIIGGWQKSDLIIIAARPSMGKTAVAAKFAKYAADKGFRTIFFSLEMSRMAITDRMALGETDIDPEKWRNGQIDEIDFNKIEVAQKKIRSWPIYINDKSGIRPEYIRATVRKVRPDIIFIDYLQLMNSKSGVKQQNRNLEIGSISHELKAIAKEFEIPVILLSQLNRGLDARSEKRPTMSDLRDSGEIEQDADIILFPFRPYVYDKSDEYKGKIEYIIAKHRNGRTGIAEGEHNQYMNDFFDYAKNEQYFNLTDKPF